jgi:peptidyl-prolyl cis-trans isomerase C
MLKNGKFAALAILGALAFNPAYAEDKSAAMVNGVSIPQARIDVRIKAAAQQGQPDSPDLRKAIKEDMINLEVLAQEAAKAGVDKNPEVMLQIELAKQQVLVGAFVQDYVKTHPISDDQLKQEYDTLKAKMGNKEYNARHILVETEAEAKDIIKQLNAKKNPAKFEKLAEKSKDTGSAEKGGSLGWAIPTTFVPEFANVLVSLKKGETTKDPVKSQFGWHVIRLEDTRDLKLPPFEEAKPQLLQRLQQQLVKKTVDELRAKAKIE